MFGQVKNRNMEVVFKDRNDYHLLIVMVGNASRMSGGSAFSQALKASVDGIRSGVARKVVVPCQRARHPPLTDVSAAGFDDDGPPAAGLLLHQRHALPCLLVRVIGGADRDLVLDPGQAVQLNAAFTVERERERARARERERESEREREARGG